MLVLDEFTAQELAEYSGVNPQTVWTVLRREFGVCQEVRIRETGRAGGRPKVLRLKQGEAELLRTRLDHLRAELFGPESKSVKRSEWATLPPPDLPLAAAESVLREDLPAAGSPKERDRLLDVAESSLRAAGRVLDQLPASRRQEDRSHRTRLAALRDVVETVKREDVEAAMVPRLLEARLPSRALVADPRGMDEPGVVVIPCEPRRSIRTRDSLKIVTENLRTAAKRLGLDVLERGLEVYEAAEAGINAVVLMHDVSHGFPGPRFWTLLTAARERAVVLDLGGSDDTFRNRVMETAGLYFGNAEKLDVPALTGTLTRFGSGPTWPAVAGTLAPTAEAAYESAGVEAAPG
jgi:hypothetical protein